MDREQYVEPYLSNLGKIGAKYDAELIDSQNVNFGLSIISILMEKGIIVKKVKKITECKCAKVEFSDEGEIFSNKLFDSEGGKRWCKLCETECTTINKEVLVMVLKEPGEMPLIFPKQQIKNTENLFDKFKNKEIVISKTRETGIVYQLENETYNIDIEFINFCIVAGQNSERKIIISSQNTLFHQLMVYYIHYHLFETNEYIMFLTSYVIESKEVKNRHLGNNEARATFNYDIDLLLLIMHSLSWSKIESKWKTDYYNTLQRIPMDVKASELGLILARCSEDLSFEEFPTVYRKLDRITRYLTNSTFKKLRKEIDEEW